MTEIDSVKNQNGERKYYKGFGTYMTAAEWARALGLPRMTVWQYLQQGMTPEEIQTKREIKDIRLEITPRKKRTGHRQIETYERMEDLLDVSGYDPDGLEVNLIGGAYRHQIIWNDLVIGAYDPTKDVLWLSGGDKLKIRNPVAPDQQIHHVDGVWYIASETKQALFDIAVGNNRP